MDTYMLLLEAIRATEVTLGLGSEGWYRFW